MSVTGSGSVRFDDGITLGIPTINNASAVVFIKNMKNVYTTTLTTGTLFIIDSSVFSDATYGINQTGGILSLSNTTVFNTAGSSAKAIFTGASALFAINNTIFNFAGSSIGGTNISSGVISYGSQRAPSFVTINGTSTQLVSGTGTLTTAAVSTAPATSTSTGTRGQLAVDTDWLYVATATNTWKRIALNTF
jgi:hypothetical protein